MRFRAPRGARAARCSPGSSPWGVDFHNDALCRARPRADRADRRGGQRVVRRGTGLVSRGTEGGCSASAVGADSPRRSPASYAYLTARACPQRAASVSAAPLDRARSGSPQTRRATTAGGSPSGATGALPSSATQPTAPRPALMARSTAKILRMRRDGERAARATRSTTRSCGRVGRPQRQGLAWDRAGHPRPPPSSARTASTRSTCCGPARTTGGRRSRAAAARRLHRPEGHVVDRRGVAQRRGDPRPLPLRRRAAGDRCGAPLNGTSAGRPRPAARPLRRLRTVVRPRADRSGWRRRTATAAGPARGRRPHLAAEVGVGAAGARPRTSVHESSRTVSNCTMSGARSCTKPKGQTHREVGTQSQRSLPEGDGSAAGSKRLSPGVISFGGPPPCSVIVVLRGSRRAAHS